MIQEFIQEIIENGDNGNFSVVVGKNCITLTMNDASKIPKVSEYIIEKYDFLVMPCSEIETALTIFFQTEDEFNDVRTAIQQRNGLKADYTLELAKELSSSYGLDEMPQFKELVKSLSEAIQGILDEKDETD
jgi:hypothetical protein